MSKDVNKTLSFFGKSHLRVRLQVDRRGKKATLHINKWPFNVRLRSSGLKHFI